MKKILIALSIIGLTYSGAEAQTTITKIATVKPKADSAKVNYDKNYKVCKDPKSKYYVCGDKPAAKVTKTTTTKVVNNARPAVSGKSDNAKNYKICKGDADYHVCDEKPNAKNSVPGPGSRKIAGNSSMNNKTTTVVTRNGVRATSSTSQVDADKALIAPQSQSLSGKPNNNTVVYDTAKNDTITNATAPYNGKPSPQYDGLEKNKVRNLNQSTPLTPNAVPQIK